MKTVLRSPRIRRKLAGVVIGMGSFAIGAPAALAHSEFDLGEVAPGSIVALHLHIENESSTAGTTMIELRFPEPFVVIELPAVEGWTATPVDGELGGEAIGILWTRPTATPDEDPNLPLTIGPLPATEGRLQFKVLQTYSDGTEDAWISEWPAGAEEPDMPGPVIDLVNGAPGTIPTSTTTPPTTTTPPPTTNAAATTAAATDTTEPTSTTEVIATTTPATQATPETTIAAPSTDTVEANDSTTDNDDGFGAGAILAIVLIPLAAVAAIAVVLVRRRGPKAV